jgi:hypothetical protein
VTYIIGQEKPSLEEALEHFGKLGMHWGVRNVVDPTQRSKIDSPVKGLEKLPQSTALAIASVAENMSKAYGFQIQEVVPIRNHRFQNMFAYVESANKGSNVVHVLDDPKIKQSLQKAGKEGWFVPSGGHEVEATMTHESAHALLHSINIEGMTRKESRRSKEPIEDVRWKAWEKAEKQAKADNLIKTPKNRLVRLFSANPQAQMSKMLSTYASSTLFIEETEAEMFSSYHWNPHPQKFVDTFIKSIHQDLGYGNVEPFSGRKT